MTNQLARLLEEARPHVAATRDRSYSRHAYEGAIDLLARIDAALAQQQAWPWPTREGAQ